MDESQRAMVAARLEKMFKGAAKQRMSDGGKHSGQVRRGEGVANLPDLPPDARLAREEAAKLMNVSGRSVLSRGHRAARAAGLPGPRSDRPIVRSSRESRPDARGRQATRKPSTADARDSGAHRAGNRHPRSWRTDGRPRTNRDKRHAVEMLLADETWREWSDRQIAEQSAVSHTFVQNMRSELATVASSDLPTTTIGKDGKRRKKPKKRKPKAGRQGLTIGVAGGCGLPAGRASGSRAAVCTAVHVSSGCQ